jgi:hypothetical protein
MAVSGSEKRKTAALDPNHQLGRQNRFGGPGACVRPLPGAATRCCDGLEGSNGAQLDLMNGPRTAPGASGFCATLQPSGRGFGMDDDEASIRKNLAILGPLALEQLQRILTSSIDVRAGFLRALMARPSSPGSDALAELVALCDQDEAARLTVLRGIRDAMD